MRATIGTPATSTARTRRLPIGTIAGLEMSRSAYIKRSLDGAWIGDVNFHYTPEKDWWDMGIVMYAPFRGKGYAVPALRLMLDHAFRDCGISRIHNDFAVARNEITAWETHRRAGFRELGVEDGFLHMMITKEEYLRQRENAD